MEKYLQPEDRYVTCVFGEFADGKVRQKATLAKMARGEMVRYMAQTGAREPEDLKGFDHLGYRLNLQSESIVEAKKGSNYVSGSCF